MKEFGGSASVAQVGGDKGRSEASMNNAKKKVGLMPGEPEPDDSSENEEEDEKEKKPVKPNDQNGGQTDRYHWDQNLQEVSVYWYLPADATKKDVKVTFTIKKCKIMLKGKFILDAEWAKDIYVDECEWLISKDAGQNTLQLQLTKSKLGMGWWPGVFKNDDQIDIEHAHVKSDNVKLSDLPWEEQAFFERNLYDQRMEKLG